MTNEKIWDKVLHSRKAWLVLLAIALPMLKVFWPDIDTEIIREAVLATLAGAGIIGAEDMAKHFRDGKIAMAEAAKAHADAILKTGDLPKVPQ